MKCARHGCINDAVVRGLCRVHYNKGRRVLKVPSEEEMSAWMNLDKRAQELILLFQDYVIQHDDNVELELWLRPIGGDPNHKVILSLSVHGKMEDAYSLEKDKYDIYNIDNRLAILNEKAESETKSNA